MCATLCFQSSWLSITFSPPLAQICQADSLSQVKPSRRRGGPQPLGAPPSHTPENNNPPPPPPTSPPLPPRALLQGFPLFHPVCRGTSGITSHIGLAPCLLPPSTVTRGGHTLAQHGSTFNTIQSLVLIIYDIFSTIINSSELYYIPDTVQTLSHLWRLWSPAGPIGVNPAHSINPLPPPSHYCFSTSLIGFCLWVL